MGTCLSKQSENNNNTVVPPHIKEKAQRDYERYKREHDYNKSMARQNFYDRKAQSEANYVGPGKLALVNYHKKLIADEFVRRGYKREDIMASLEKSKFGFAKKSKPHSLKKNKNIKKNKNKLMDHCFNPNQKVDLQMHRTGGGGAQNLNQPGKQGKNNILGGQGNNNNNNRTNQVMPQPGPGGLGGDNSRKEERNILPPVDIKKLIGDPILDDFNQRDLDDLKKSNIQILDIGVKRGPTGGTQQKENIGGKVPDDIGIENPVQRSNSKQTKDPSPWSLKSKPVLSDADTYKFGRDLQGLSDRYQEVLRKFGPGDEKFTDPDFPPTWDSIKGNGDKDAQM